MPLGTVTLQNTNPSTQGGGSQAPMADGNGLRVTVANVVLSSAADYPTGGFALSAASLGMADAVLFAQAEQIAAASGAVTGGLGNVYYNTATNKLQCFNNGGTEVANNTNLNGAAVQIIAWGY